MEKNLGKGVWDNIFKGTKKKQKEELKLDQICWISSDDYHPMLTKVCSIPKDLWYQYTLTSKDQLTLEELFEKLTDDQIKVYKNWIASGEQFDEYQEVALKNIDLLYESLTKKVLEGKNLVELKRWWNGEYHPLTDLAIQCWVLEKCPEIDYFAGSENNYGVKNLEKLYPWHWNSDRLLAVLHPIFTDFQYGPNVFVWRTLNKLKGKKWNLYFISIDIGKILNLPSYRVYKVGITTKKAVVEKDKGQRFHQKYFDYIEVLRFVEYQDGRDAYTREQKVIKDSSNEIENYCKEKHDGKAYGRINLMPKKIAKKMNYEIESYFAASEWVYETIQKDTDILERFDKLTTFWPPDYEDKM